MAQTTARVSSSVTAYLLSDSDGMAGICHWMSLLILLNLRQDGSQPFYTGISFQAKIFIEIGVG